jgi:hypothetical protein
MKNQLLDCSHQMAYPVIIMIDTLNLLCIIDRCINRGGIGLVAPSSPYPLGAVQGKMFMDDARPA